MIVVVIVVTVLLVGAAAAAMTGRLGPAMSEPASSLGFEGLEVTADGWVSPEAVERLRFDQALRGYRMDQVDDVLDRLTAELRARDHEVAALRARDEEVAALRAGDEERAASPAEDGVANAAAEGRQDGVPGSRLAAPERNGT